MLIAKNIKWDVDCFTDVINGVKYNVELPTEVEIPKEIENDEEAISDYLSDKVGFCHCGFDLEEVSYKI